MKTEVIQGKNHVQGEEKVNLEKRERIKKTLLTVGLVSGAAILLKPPRVLAELMGGESQVSEEKFFGVRGYGKVQFDRPRIYNSPSEPGSEKAISADLASAKLGVVQKIYHKSSVAPSFPPGWANRFGGEYLPGSLNVIFAEWAGGADVEYWIVNESSLITSLEIDNGKSRASSRINWNAGNMQKITLTGNVNLSFVNPPAHGNFDLRVIQDGKGGHNVTFPSTVKFPGGAPNWKGMSANQKCIVSFRYDSDGEYVATATAFYS